MTKLKIKGYGVEVWEKSFAVISKKDHEYFRTPVLFVNNTPTPEVIEKFCEALDSAYEAGNRSAKKELRIWLGLND